MLRPIEDSALKTRLNGIVSFSLAGFLLAFVGGCQQTPSGQFEPIDMGKMFASKSVSVYQVAGQLNCQVVHADGSSATLQNRANCITMYPSPSKAVYVNCNPVQCPGDITEVGGTLYASEDIIPELRRAMRPEPPPLALRPGNPWSSLRPPHPSAPGKTETPLPAASGVVVIDAGHGGKDPGAIGCNGVCEKDIVLPVALEVRRRLQAAGVRVIMTRGDDTFVELDRRAEIANENHANLFVAIHADSSPNREATGHTVYVARGAGSASTSAAHCVSAMLSEHGDPCRGGVRAAGYRVLVKNDCPAMLVELGYVSNRAEANTLASISYQQQLGDAIAAGIVQSLRR
jgi:N-acetylmuramoyl-L-alanine amidase